MAKKRIVIRYANADCAQQALEWFRENCLNNLFKDTSFTDGEILSVPSGISKMSDYEVQKSLKKFPGAISA